MLYSIQNWTLTFIIVAIITLFGNWVGYAVLPYEAIPGIMILVLISLAGLIAHRVTPINLPSIAYIGIIGLIISLPWFPGSDIVVKWTTKVELLSLTTPILAYAGISIGNSWNSFVKIGWKAIIIGICVLIGTYLGSAIIAEIVLRFQGII